MERALILVQSGLGMSIGWRKKTAEKVAIIIEKTDWNQSSKDGAESLTGYLDMLRDDKAFEIPKGNFAFETVPGFVIRGDNDESFSRKPNGGTGDKDTCGGHVSECLLQS